MVYLQNKVTGKIKTVQEKSQEYYDLIAERTPENKPVWEIQGDHAVAARIARAESGELRPTDLPKDSQSQIVNERNLVSGFGVEREPWKNLTDAERDMGITKESKREGEREQIDTAAVDANATTKDAAAKTILDSDVSRRREDPTTPDVPTGKEGSPGDPGVLGSDDDSTSDGQDDSGTPEGDDGEGV